MNPYAFGYVPAVILALDSSKKLSGSVLLAPYIDKPMSKGLRTRTLSAGNSQQVRGYTFEHFCEVKRQLDRENCVLHLVQLALELDLAPVISAETWTPGGKWGFDQVLGMGEGWGLWVAEILRAQERYPELWKIHVERVTPNQWRDDLFGKQRPKDRDDLKAAAVQYIRARAGLAVSVDVAEAACIGYWGAQNPSIHEAVGKWRVQRNRLKRDLSPPGA